MTDPEQEVQVAGQTKAQRIADVLREEIKGGSRALEGVEALRARFSAGGKPAARNTIRKALSILENEGLIARSRGVTPQAREAVRLPWDLTYEARVWPENGDDDQWDAAMRELGRRPSQQFLGVTLEEAGQKIGWLLGIGETSTVVVRRRLRLANDTRLMYSVSYFPEDIARGTLLDQPRNVHAKGGVLAASGYKQAWTVDAIVARMPSTEESSLLALPAATPVLEVTRTGYEAPDGDGWPVPGAPPYTGRPLRVMVTIARGDALAMMVPLEMPDGLAGDQP